jgi:hypothetical protein
MALPTIYISEREYLLSCTDKATKVAAIDAIIDALYMQLLAMAQQENPIHEYMLNDGQTVIKTTYASSATITKTIDALTFQKNRLVNQGNTVRQMVDKKNFIGNTRTW